MEKFPKLTIPFPSYHSNLTSGEAWTVGSLAELSLVHLLPPAKKNAATYGHSSRVRVEALTLRNWPSSSSSRGKDAAEWGNIWFHAADHKPKGSQAGKGVKLRGVPASLWSSKEGVMWLIRSLLQNFIEYPDTKSRKAGHERSLKNNKALTKNTWGWGSGPAMELF